MSKPLLVTFLGVAVLYPTVVTGEELALSDQLRRDISPIVRDIEAAVLGKEHRPLEEFVADDAVFEEADSPLKAYLQRGAGKDREFPSSSTLHWLRVSDSMLSTMFRRGYPKLDPKQSVLVYRELDRKNGRLKASGYVMRRVDNKWKVVIHFDGSGPEKGLSENAKPLKLID